MTWFELNRKNLSLRFVVGYHCTSVLKEKWFSYYRILPLPLNTDSAQSTAVDIICLRRNNTTITVAGNFQAMSVNIDNVILIIY